MAGLQACGLALPLPAMPAEATGRPPTQPTRDVAVTYTGGPGTPLHMAWLAAAHLWRSDIAPGVWSLGDEAKHSTLLVNDARKAVVLMPMVNPVQGPAWPGAAFTREGTATVAGIGCVVWAIHVRNTDAKACITTDGVLLRMDALGTVLTATKVSYGPQDPGRLTIPADYRRQGVP